MPLTAITKKIKKLDERRAVLEAELQEARANLDFPCCCGEVHKIKDCDVLQTHWYTPPSGCTDGDYWNSGELQVVCPVTGSKNRLLDRSVNDHLAKQFSSSYKRLFKSVTDTYKGQDLGNHWNNYMLENNVEYYGLKK